MLPTVAAAPPWRDGSVGAMPEHEPERCAMDDNGVASKDMDAMLEDEQELGAMDDNGVESKDMDAMPELEQEWGAMEDSGVESKSMGAMPATIEAEFEDEQEGSEEESVVGLFDGDDSVTKAMWIQGLRLLKEAENRSMRKREHS